MTTLYSTIGNISSVKGLHFHFETLCNSTDIIKVTLYSLLQLFHSYSSGHTFGFLIRILELLKLLADVHHAILDVINLHRYNATTLSGPSQTLSTFPISSSLAGERKPDLREEQGHVLACISRGTCCAKLNVTVVEIDSACPHVTRIR
jgi:hypothetical protein